MNEPEDFEWDDTKDAANEGKHGISFEAAIHVFLDNNRIDDLDTRRSYGEERRNVTGTVNGIILTVTYTMRDDIARIISARKASKKERVKYGNHS
jgi:uncharacterized DUF497 family protein